MSSALIRHFCCLAPSGALAMLMLAQFTACGAKTPAASVVPASKESARPVHWGYESSEGSPDKWGTLSPAYAACGNGKSQSPIDLVGGSSEGAPSLIFDYGKTGLKIAHNAHVIDLVDNGHTLQVTVDEGSTLITQRDEYKLVQFHFHTPSEHLVDGRSYPMEAHFVHQSASGAFAVVSVLFEEGAANANLEQLIAHFPASKGEMRHAPEVVLELAAHLPADRSVYQYLGSFTTPPCTEDVEWSVMRQPLMASREQLAAFAARLAPNNRPVQPLNGRRLGLGQITPK